MKEKNLSFSVRRLIDVVHNKQNNRKGQNKKSGTKQMGCVCAKQKQAVVRKAVPSKSCGYVSCKTPQQTVPSTLGRPS